MFLQQAVMCVAKMNSPAACVSGISLFLSLSLLSQKNQAQNQNHIHTFTLTAVLQSDTISLSL